jgi:CRP-like cAMP-binding protein
LLTPTAYYGTAIALTECEIERIQAQSWYQELENNPSKYRDVALLLQSTLRKVQKRVEMTTVAKPLRIPMFQEWIAQFVPNVFLLDLLTQEEIGQFLGMSRETVNRYFRKMEKEHPSTCRKKGGNGIKKG